MNLPIRFPSEAEVVTEEVSRFRALSPAERVRYIRGLIAAGGLMMMRSPNAEFVRQYTLEQEELGKRAVKEFAARHGR